MHKKQYITRSIEAVLRNAAETFKVVIMGGSRQVGKSTLMQHVLSERGDVKIISFDNPDLRAAAKADPELFLSQYSSPLMIDEFQYVPELLPFIKMKVDLRDDAGLYFLTGSQLFKMMSAAGESLAGRAAVLTLSSFSQAEIENNVAAAPFLPSERMQCDSPATLKDVQRAVFTGGMPALVCGNGKVNRDIFFSSYVQTYIERDIRQVLQLRDIGKFRSFLACIAARTGEELVFEDVASTVGVDAKTIKSWIGVLEATGLVFLLHAWHGNPVKRVVKRPKLHFMDTGLACYLANMSAPEMLFGTQQAGHFFESWVVGQIVRSYQAAGLDPANYLYCYRDDGGREIDLLIARNGRLYPVEIKLSANPGLAAMKHFSVVGELGLPCGTGCVLSLTANTVPVRYRGTIVNVASLWRQDRKGNSPNNSI